MQNKLSARSIVHIILVVFLLTCIVFSLIPVARFVIPVVSGYAALGVTSWNLGFGFTWYGNVVNGNALIVISEFMSFIGVVVGIICGAFAVYNNKHQIFYSIGGAAFLFEGICSIFYKDLSVASNANNLVVVEHLKAMSIQPYFIFEIVGCFIFAVLCFLMAFLPKGPEDEGILD